MSRALKVSKACVVGSLFMFWSWVDSRSKDGSGVDLFDYEIDELVMLDGFAQAMLDVGWLAGLDGDYYAPNFEKNNSSTAKARHLEQEAKAIRRAENRAKNVVKEHVLLEGCRKDVGQCRTESVDLSDQTRLDQNRCPLSHEVGTEGCQLGIVDGAEASSLSREGEGNVAVPDCREDVVEYLLGFESALPLPERRAVAEAWHEEMLAKGWMFGRSQCRDWRAALRRKVGFVLKDRAQGVARGGGRSRSASGFVPNNNANRGRSYKL